MAQKSSLDSSVDRNPLRYDCVFVDGVPSNLDMKDVESSFKASCSPGADVSEIRAAPLATGTAVVTVPSGNSQGELVLQHGLPTVLTTSLLFTESATLELEIPFPVENIADLIHRQAAQLSVSCKIHSNKIIVAGLSQQLYKFRCYLVDLIIKTPLVKPPSYNVASSALLEEVPSDTVQTFQGLSNDALLLIPKICKPSLLGVVCHASQGQVVISGSTFQECEDRIQEFQSVYQKALPSLKSDTIPIPPSFPNQNIGSLIDEINRQYVQCVVVLSEGGNALKIVSSSSRQFEQVKKVLTDKLNYNPNQVLKLPEGRTLTIKLGNIVKEEVSVIVNAANSRLDHGGGVAMALNNASNGLLQEFSNTYYQMYGETKVGFVAKTVAGGDLKCEYVFHAVGPNAHDVGMSEVACSRLIFKAVTRALEMCHKDAKSIAFPALSTGIFGVKCSTSADAMISAITKYEYPKKSKLKDIRIVIIDTPTHTEFAQKLVRMRDVSLAPSKFQLSTTENVSKSQKRSNNNSAVFNNSSANTQQTSSSKGGATGSEPTGGRPLGSGTTGSGPPGSGTTGSGPPGNGATGSEPTGGRPSGSGAKGNGTTESEVTRSGPPDNGATGSGEKGNRQPGSGPQGNGATVAGSGAHPPSGVSAPPGFTGHRDTSNECPICLEGLKEPSKISCCGQVFCKVCIEKSFQHSSSCPVCKHVHRPMIGNQPDGTMGVKNFQFSLPGYEKSGTIAITYFFPNGKQGPNHPNPGAYYSGTSRTAYLPDNEEGRHVLALLRTAFDRRLLFTIGTSVTTGATNVVVWNDVHHKTNTKGGSSAYGYPDPTYLTRVREELKAKGVY